MKSYKKLARHVLKRGIFRKDRTGVGRHSVFGYQMRHDLAFGFPLLTTKKIHWKSVVHELLWFISGSDNIAYLKEHGVRIWDEWADTDGNLGPVYGKQWRRWSGPDGLEYDQLRNVIDAIKTTPSSSRLIVSAWNVADVPQMALPPCHTLFQFFVENGRLSLMLYQRSADVFLGVPFNIASYSLLLLMVAHECGLEPGEFIWNGGDVHIYANHIDQINTQLRRKERPLPFVRIKAAPGTRVEDLRFEDIEIIGYDPHPTIKGVVAV